VNVFAMEIKIIAVSDAMLLEAPLPTFTAPSRTMRVSPLDELHSALQSYSLGGRQQQMHVVRHRQECMQ
jgi:hypothetical protein